MVKRRHKHKKGALILVLILAIIGFVAFYTGFLKLPFAETITDSDGDGMPDAWEIQYGFDPDDASDASRDDDGDGYTNREEYEEGTDPSSSSSYPEVETIVYVTVYSNSTLLSGAEVNLDSVDDPSYWVGAFTNDAGVATFSNIELGNYVLFVRINDEWKGGTTSERIEVEKGANYFTFRYYPSTDTWQVVKNDGG